MKHIHLTLAAFSMVLASGGLLTSLQAQNTAKPYAPAADITRTDGTVNTKTGLNTKGVTVTDTDATAKAGTSSANMKLGANMGSQSCNTSDKAKNASFNHNTNNAQGKTTTTKTNARSTSGSVTTREGTEPIPATSSKPAPAKP